LSILMVSVRATSSCPLDFADLAICVIAFERAPV